MIEDRVRNGLAGAAREYTPSAELRRAVDRKVRRHRRARVIEATIATVGVVLFVAGLGVLLATDDEGNESTSTAETTVPGEWSPFEAAGFVTQVPDAWTADPLCGVLGSAPFGGYVSNVGPVETATIPGASPGACSLVIDIDGLPSDYVIVEVDQSITLGLNTIPTAQADTRFPIDAASIVPDTSPTRPLNFAVVVWRDGAPLGQISSYAGPDASEADLAIARQIVESIRPA